MSSKYTLYTNEQAQNYAVATAPDVSLCRKWHQQLPDFATTTLKSLPQVAEKFGVRYVLVKQEGTRAGLPAYKILGASWAIARAICEENHLPLDSFTLEQVASIAKSQNYTLFAATAGNHGRAVAYMARILGISSYIYVDPHVSKEAIRYIESEGATVSIIDGGYNRAVGQAIEDSRKTHNGLLIQDFAIDSYVTMPFWHVEGYGTLFAELEEQLRNEGISATHIVVPCGGGTLCHAAVQFSKSNGRAINVLAVEPEASPCLHNSLEIGQNIEVAEGKTIMKGMVGPMVSPISWSDLSKGVDASVVISDDECLARWEDLRSFGVNTGPCGAGTFAGFQNVAENNAGRFHLTPESVVVVITTDGQKVSQCAESR